MSSYFNYSGAGPSSSSGVPWMDARNATRAGGPPVSANTTTTTGGASQLLGISPILSSQAAAAGNVTSGGGRPHYALSSSASSASALGGGGVTRARSGGDSYKYGQWAASNNNTTLFSGTDDTTSGTAGGGGGRGGFSAWGEGREGAGGSSSPSPRWGGRGGDGDAADWRRPTDHQRQYGFSSSGSGAAGAGDENENGNGNGNWNGGGVGRGLSYGDRTSADSDGRRRVTIPRFTPSAVDDGPRDWRRAPSPSAWSSTHVGSNRRTFHHHAAAEQQPPSAPRGGGGGGYVPPWRRGGDTDRDGDGFRSDWRPQWQRRDFGIVDSRSRPSESPRGGAHQQQQQHRHHPPPSSSSMTGSSTTYSEEDSSSSSSSSSSSGDYSSSSSSSSSTSAADGRHRRVGDDLLGGGGDGVSYTDLRNYRPGEHPFGLGGNADHHHDDDDDERGTVASMLTADIDLDGSPVVPTALLNRAKQPFVQWNRHPSHGFVLQLLQHRGIYLPRYRELITYHMAELFLHYLSVCMEGSYFVHYAPNKWPKERFFRIRMLPLQRMATRSDPVPQLVMTMHQSGVAIVDAIPLDFLVGVTTTPRAPCFRPFLDSPDAIVGCREGRGHRARLPVDGCFSLWFYNQENYVARSVDLLTCDPAVYDIWTKAFMGLVSVNSSCVVQIPIQPQTAADGGGSGSSAAPSLTPRHSSGGSDDGSANERRMAALAMAAQQQVERDVAATAQKRQEGAGGKERKPKTSTNTAGEAASQSASATS